MSSIYVEHLLAQINDVAEEFLDSDVHTAMRLHRLASNVATAFIDNDLLIANLDVDDETKSRVASMVKDAVSDRKTAQKKVRKK